MSIIDTFIFFIQALDIKLNVSFQNIIIKIVFFLLFSHYASMQKVINVINSNIGNSITY